MTQKLYIISHNRVTTYILATNVIEALEKFSTGRDGELPKDLRIEVKELVV